jgi:fibronectin-binding autotransporter adhesin
MAFTTDNWVGAANADWGATSSNWSTGLPNSNNNVAINTAAVLTVTYSGSDGTTTVNALTVGNDVFAMNGGNLVITGNASFAGGFVQSGGTLTARAVTINGASTFNALEFANAEGSTAFTNNATLTMQSYTLGGGSVLNNKKTVNETNQITIGDSNGVNAKINNEKGAILNIGGDYGIGQGAGTAQFINAGTFEKTGGNNTTYVNVNFTDKGKIVVATGTIEFYGANDSFAGAISGPGQFFLGSNGKDALNAGTTVATGIFTISDGGTVATINENLNYGKTFNLQSGAVLDINGANLKLTLSGSSFFVGGSAIEGTGMLVTAAGSSTDVNSFGLGGGAGWQNSGTVGAVGNLTLGDGTFNAATFINEKGAVYKFTNDSEIISASNGALNSSFVNMAGATLEKLGGGGTSTISVEVTDNGSIIIQTGTINFTGVVDSFTGAISGSGQFEIGGGSAIFGTGTAISTKIFTISSATVTLGAPLSYLSGAFNFENSLLSLGGFSLTVSGTDSLSNSTIDGTGTVITDKNSSVGVGVNGGTLTLGSAAKWQNSGTVYEFNTLQIGDQSFDAASFTNEKGGHFILAADAGITIGFNQKSSFVNAAGATFVKEGGGQSNSVIDAQLVNSGAVTVDIGTLEFAALVSGKGSFTIEPGTVLQFDATVAAGSTVKFASHTGGDLVLKDSQAFHPAISGFGGTGTDKIELRDIAGAVTLSYKNTSTKTVSKGILTVTNGTQTAELTFLGKYTIGNFHASADPAGGTLIVDPHHPMLLASAR